MRRLGVVLLVAAVVVGCRGGTWQHGKSGGPRISDAEWKAQVLESPELVLVDFWAPWCGPCREMHPVLDSLARDFKVKKVDIDANPRLADRYGISSIPAFVIFKGGEEVARHEGITPERTLRDDLERFARK